MQINNCIDITTFLNDTSLGNDTDKILAGPFHLRFNTLAKMESSILLSIVLDLAGAVTWPLDILGFGKL